MRHGKVTKALHECESGDVLGVRGPYGNNFDVEGLKEKNLVFIGGGIGQATELFLEPLGKMVKNNVLFPALQKVMIVPALLGVDAGVIGAGVLALDMGLH